MGITFVDTLLLIGNQHLTKQHFVSTTIHPCISISYLLAICRNPAAEVEQISSNNIMGAVNIPKDCLWQQCSAGFHCEYNGLYKGGQYICCGSSFTNPIFGRPKMYPGYANLPLQCTAINSCTFVDFPFCVMSESYRHKVCCSKPQCL